ncbi:MAG: ArsR/SmtB family transcription factor, partial [Candidatus Nanopelagicales bacterium]
MVAVVTDEAGTDRILHALSDATRRDILARSLVGQHSVSSLARDYSMSMAAVQKHVAVLESAGLVTKETHERHQQREGPRGTDHDHSRRVATLTATGQPVERPVVGARAARGAP